MISDERDTRIPYCLGTDHYCEFEDCDEYVHMDDFVVIYQDTYAGDSCSFSGYLCGVRYGRGGFISEAALFTPEKGIDFDVACDGVFYHTMEVTDD